MEFATQVRSSLECLLQVYLGTALSLLLVSLPGIASESPARIVHMSPSEFKKLRKPLRKSLDEL